MKLSKLLIIFMIAVGLGLTGYATFQIFSTKQQADTALEEAKEMIKKRDASGPTTTTTEVTTPPDGVIGLLTMPKIDAQLAIVKGTDPDDLEKGVGHYEGSYFPNQNGQIVLSGHRDTVFKRVGELAIGDDMTISMPEGDFTYTIESTKIVEADDTTIITLQNQEEELILTTCYPFGYIGNAPERYIIYAKRSG